MVKYMSVVLLILILPSCGGVSGTKYLASKGKPKDGHLNVVAGGKEYVLIKGVELDYVYKDSKGIDCSVPIHLTKVNIGTPQWEQIFIVVLANALRDKGFAKYVKSPVVAIIIPYMQYKQVCTMGVGHGIGLE